MTALVLQARLDSSRLPRKALLPLGKRLNERPLIFRVMSALSFIPCDIKILACPNDSVSEFAPLANEAGFTIVGGPKEDVLARFCIAARLCGADRIIRATGDNPFVFADAAAALLHDVEDVQTQTGTSIAYAAYAELPYGAGVEVVSAQALFRAERETQEAFHREHVCPYLYNNPAQFHLHRPLAPQRWHGADVRITVDTADDYRRAQLLYERLSALPAAEQSKGEHVIACYRQCFEGGR